MPQYTTFRSGLGHLPVFTGTVELAEITFTGEPAKNKKQAEKNAAMAAWSSLKQCEPQSKFYFSSDVCSNLFSVNPSSALDIIYIKLNSWFPHNGIRFLH